MENYDVTKAARLIAEFTIDELSNWYVRRSRRRFWKSEVNQTKISAYQTLYECLEVIGKLISPFAPFISEELYQNLNTITSRGNNDSVHLEDFPSPIYRDTELEDKMEIAQKIVYLTRAIRAKSNLRVRQPLRKILVAVDSNKKDAVAKMKDLILEEVNIKELEVLEDDSTIVSKSAKANFKTLGPKYGKLMKQLAQRISVLSKEEISELESQGNLSLDLEGNNIKLSGEDVEIISNEIEGWVVETEAGLTVAIDKELDAELIGEVLASEFVNRVQNMRKNNGLEVTDRINVYFESDQKLKDYLINYIGYIKNEVLADTISYDNGDKDYKEEIDIGEYNCKITIDKVV
jgi:isoleucyl-tRNA synthetase